MDISLLDILGYLAVSLLAAVGTWAKKTFEAKKSPEQMAAIVAATRTAVAAAEKIGRETTLTSGEKYGYAKAHATGLAKSLGMRVTESDIDALIHGILNELDMNEMDAFIQRLAEYETGGTNGEAEAA